MRFALGFAIMQLALTSLFMFSSEATADDVPISIWVWNDRNLEQHFVVLEEHHDGPCGVMAEIQVTQLPEPVAANKMGFELVVEYRQDEIVNRWAMPANLWVLAIEGDSIYVSEGYRTLKIGTDGSIAVTKKFVSERDSIRDCPQSVETEIPGSAYLRCFAYKELRSGETRNIAYQGPCT